jgi:hypothetical protein
MCPGRVLNWVLPAYETKELGFTTFRGRKKKAPSNTEIETEREILQRLDKNSFIDICHRKERKQQLGNRMKSRGTHS